MQPEPKSEVRILVWDAPVRVFHLCLMLSFFGAWITAEEDGWRLVHVTLGVTVLALVVLRIVWGVLGTRHARFADFVRGPRAVGAYLRGLWTGQAVASAGHNPAGGLAIVAMLLLGLLVPVTGLATLGHWAGDWSEEVHEALAELMLLLVGLHVVGVALASWLHRDKLIAAMVTGYKRGDPAQAIGRTWWPLGLLLALAVIGFWALQGLSADQGGWIQPQQVLAAARQDAEENDD
jgi:cytochrome b